ncbi:MAG: class I SAM-dependent methyltransferase [Gemmatimonadaceae bacterium]
MTEWFTRWFGKEYLDLYPHRDDAEARAVVDMILRTLGGEPMHRALDLACGSGRHTRALCEHVWTAGLDLSWELLEVAKRESPDVSYVRADMRLLPFAGDAFDLVINLFTSFGYFATDAENRAVLCEVHRVLESGGTFVLDYLNSQHVRDTLVPMDTQDVGERTITQRRRITDDGRYVEKTISATACGNTYLERVRLFEPAELRSLLTDAGFAITQELGDYDGSAIEPTSPRTIFFAKRR